ncbi:hypothetical protein QUF76_12820 [Desulfobacterales bacterium HSG16]|nr:hypothetical protein [Desulfobacterales bacterium HSG16]
MHPVVGNKKQETKIREMGHIAKNMFPHIEVMAFKGSFRLAIRSALKKNQFNDWEEVSQRPYKVKKKFFETILDESVSQLKKLGMKEDETDILIDSLKKENEKYLK